MSYIMLQCCVASHALDMESIIVPQTDSWAKSLFPGRRVVYMYSTRQCASAQNERDAYRLPPIKRAKPATKELSAPAKVDKVATNTLARYKRDRSKAKWRRGGQEVSLRRAKGCREEGVQIYIRSRRFPRSHPSSMKSMSIYFLAATFFLGAAFFAAGLAAVLATQRESVSQNREMR